MATPYVLSSDLVSAYPAKSLAIAQYIDGYKLDTGPVQNAQTGTTYTFVLTDTTKTVTANNAAASAYTVPPQSSVVWEAYTVLRILNLGAGVVTLTPGAGVTLTGTVTVAQYSSATLTRTGSNAWTISGNASASGMDLVTPTSVGSTGVTLSGGQINISAATTINVNGCFSATYDTYRIVLYLTTAGTGNYIMRLRVSASDNSTSNYNNQRISGSGTTVQATRSTSQTSWLNLGAVSGLASFQIDVHRPFLAATTTALCAMGRGTDSNIDMDNWFMGHNTATSFDGFTIEPGSAASGTMRVYGLRNS